MFMSCLFVSRYSHNCKNFFKRARYNEGILLMSSLFSQSKEMQRTGRSLPPPFTMNLSCNIRRKTAFRICLCRNAFVIRKIIVSVQSFCFFEAPTIAHAVSGFCETRKTCRRCYSHSRCRDRLVRVL
jgi:hypothetical protein